MEGAVVLAVQTAAERSATLRLHWGSQDSSDVRETFQKMRQLADDWK